MSLNYKLRFKFSRYFYNRSDYDDDIVCWFCYLLQSNLYISFSGGFPEVYKDGEVPPALGDRVPGMNSIAPVYRYGWIVSPVEREGIR